MRAAPQPAGGRRGCGARDRSRAAADGRGCLAPHGGLLSTPRRARAARRTNARRFCSAKLPPAETAATTHRNLIQLRCRKGGRAAALDGPPPEGSVGVVGPGWACATRCRPSNSTCSWTSSSWCAGGERPRGGKRREGGGLWIRGMGGEIYRRKEYLFLLPLVTYLHLTLTFFLVRSTPYLSPPTLFVCSLVPSLPLLRALAPAPHPLSPVCDDAENVASLRLNVGCINRGLNRRNAFKGIQAP